MVAQNPTATIKSTASNDRFITTSLWSSRTALNEVCPGTVLQHGDAAS
jgi:hypothetical protein